MIRTIRDIWDRKRMRRLSRARVTAAENERKHLARELHDEFLQFLVAFKIRGKLLVDETDRKERERAWAAIADEVLNAMRGVRRMIRGLRSPKLEEHGLVSALATLFRDARKVHGVTIHANVDLDRVADELDPVTALALYRIVQEAVNNAATHARVSEATVTLGLAGGMIVAEIRDEGCGFELRDSGAAPGEGHLGAGLGGMRERAELVGGSLTVRSSPGKGTTVRAAVPQPEMRLARNLFERRVPQVLLIYAGASWALVEATAFMIDEFLLSPSWTRVVMAALLSLAPSVAMLAWYHGRPGTDEVPMAGRIGIPVNVAAAAAVLILLFRGADLGARTTTVSVEIGGETVERTVARPEFRKRTALTRFNAAPELGEDEYWLTHMAPLALELDLAFNDFFEPISVSVFHQRLADFGLQRTGDLPLPLRWAVAELLHATFIVSGAVGRTGDGYRVAMNIDNTDSGQRVSETTHVGPDFLALVDEMSETLAEVLDLPDRDGVGDLPIRDRLTGNEAALAAFGRAYGKLLSDPADRDAALEGLRTATALDPTFAVAQYDLSVAYLDENRTEEATAALQAVIDNLYRLPERVAFMARSDYYFLTAQPEQGWDVVEEWIALHPEDLGALDYYNLMQSVRGDWTGLIQTLETQYRLSPANHSLLKELAGAHENLGNDELALAALERYARQMPADYTGHVDLARIHRRLGAHDTAREHLERAIVVDALNPEPVGELASMDLHAGRFDAALTGYERALELAGTPRQRANVFDQLKEYYRFRGRMEDAIRTAETWLETVSGVYSPLVVAQRRFADIDIHLEAGRHEDAATLFEALRSELGPLESEPFFVTHSKLRIALETGELAVAREHARAAADWIEEWEAQMLQPVLSADLGRIEETVGNHEEAVLHYRDALSLDDAMVDVHRRLGGALRKAGRLDEAERELREALRLVPSDPHTHLEMATVLEARGNTEGAVTHLRRALAAWEAADESFEPAREARAKLAELEGRTVPMALALVAGRANRGGRR